MRKTAIVALALAGMAAAAPAQGHGWRQLGVKLVNGVDTDLIYLPGRERYRQLRLCGYRAPIYMTAFIVHYANGARENLNVRDRIRPGTCSRAIDLRGGRRDIRFVRLRYEPIRRDRQRPEVRLYGR